MQRKSAILLAANAHFAHHGFRGASLRDIARDAGVSLTLLNHHFGSKYQLLGAVIDAHSKVLEDRMNILANLRANPGGYTVGDMVAAWVRLGFETAAQPDGEVFLRLVSRVIDDPEEEAVQIVREKLDDGAMVFIDAMMHCHPQATRYTAACAYLWFNAALLKFLIGSRRLLRLAKAESASGEPQVVAVPRSFSPTFSASSFDGANALSEVHPSPPPGPPPNLREEDQALLCRFLVAGIDAVMKT
jgi:AcrR family transcriptional regulator